MRQYRLGIAGIEWIDNLFYTRGGATGEMQIGTDAEPQEEKLYYDHYKQLNG
jgi:hypothetical protein